MNKHFLIIIALSLLIMPSLSAEEKKEELKLPAELIEQLDQHCEDYGNKLAIGLKVLDEDGDGRVNLKLVLRTLMSRGFARVGTGPVPQHVLDQGYDENYHKEMAEEDTSELGEEFLQVLQGKYHVDYSITPSVITVKIAEKELS